MSNRHLYQTLLETHGFVLVHVLPRQSACFVKTIDTNEYDLNVSLDGSGLWAAHWTDACGTNENTLKQFLEQLS